MLKVKFDFRMYVCELEQKKEKKSYPAFCGGYVVVVAVAPFLAAQPA